MSGVEIPRKEHGGTPSKNLKKVGKREERASRREIGSGNSYRSVCSMYVNGQCLGKKVISKSGKC